jgi:Lrp/AsnC family leucine-responsive transcriptional regulator
MLMLSEPDLRLLRVIQENGRISNQELAERCGMSPSACLERMRRLKAKGYILSYAALLDPRKLNRGLLIFVEVMMERTTGEVLRAFSEAVSSQPAILECHMVGGGFDYLLKVRTGGMEDYRKFLVEVLAEMPGVRETRTYAVMEEVKSTTAFAI